MWPQPFFGVGSRPSAAAAAVFPSPATAGLPHSEMFFHATLARSFIHSLRLRGDDDFVDRLNYYYTPIMLAIACLIISAKQYGGTPIECWVNPHSRESMEEYIESFCWIQNTYWIPMYENIPDNHEAREDQQIGYYQWVPFILIAEALMFSMPCIMWRLLNWQSGLNMQNVISAACDARAITNPADREKVLQSVAASMIDIIDLQDPEVRPHPSASWLGRIKCNRVLSGHYITILYLLIKMCYTFNVMIQFMLLNAALKSSEYMLFGFQVLSDLMQGKPWTKSGHFPRVTLCDFEVRYLANLNRYTVQCALLINIINEKVFAFFWCWYLILLLITSFSAMFWLVNCMFTSEKVDYVLKFMQIAESSDQKRSRKSNNNNNFQSPLFLPQQFVENMDESMMQGVPMIVGGMNRSLDSDNSYPLNGGNNNNGGGNGNGIHENFRIPDAYLLHKFVADFLKSDGVFTLRLVANHAGELVVVYLIRALWKEFYERNWREVEEIEAIRMQNREQQRSSRRSYQKVLSNKALHLRLDAVRKANCAPSKQPPSSQNTPSTFVTAANTMARSGSGGDVVKLTDSINSDRTGKGNAML